MINKKLKKNPIYPVFSACNPKHIFFALSLTFFGRLVNETLLLLLLPLFVVISMWNK